MDKSKNKSGTDQTANLKPRTKFCEQLNCNLMNECAMIMSWKFHPNISLIGYKLWIFINSLFLDQLTLEICVHQTPDFCGHWVRQLYRKNQVRKNQGYCYVVIRALDSQHCANFKKPQILRVHIFYDWVHEIYFYIRQYIRKICHMTLWHFYLNYLPCTISYSNFQNIHEKSFFA